MVCCFGELMLRLAPVQQWIQRSTMGVYVAGAELNVARALSSWGVPSRYITALPDNYLTAEIIASLPHHIDCSAILYKKGRMGLYYLPQGTDLKSAGVVYDRAHTAFTHIRTREIDWQRVFLGVQWFHFSAITPALSSEMPGILDESISIAHAAGIPVSIDLNYRASLWQDGQQASAILPPLIRKCRVVMGNIWSVAAMLGIVPERFPANAGEYDTSVNAAGFCAATIFSRFPEVEHIALTFRYSNQEPLRYFATYHTRQASFVSRLFTASGMKDKVGSGDCFMAGLIRGILLDKPPQYIIDFAAAAAVGKLFEEGDATTQRVEQVETAMTS